MKASRITGIVLTIVGLTALSAHGAGLSPAEIAEAATPSVVLIKVPKGLGSGFVVGDDGRIVTNVHVISGAKQATVVTSDGREFKDIEVLATDEKHDVAVLRIGAHGLKSATLGDSQTAKPGQHIVAIGHPLGLGNTVSDGLVSAVRELAPGQNMLQISAPISPGSSGGPVFNDRGEVIGISTLVFSGGQNLNFAVPINVVKPLLAAEKGVPLASYKPATRSGRDIPDHPLALLEGCPDAQFARILGDINKAIEIGAPLYNKGNIEACYRVYAAAALDIQKKIEACPGPKRALIDGVERADKLSGWDGKAWAMRDAFDGLIALVEKKNEAPDEAVVPVLTRHIPVLSPTVFENCDAQDIKSVRGSISAAINSGAPLYNDGDVEACYRIYEGAISDIDRQVKGCPAAKEALQNGLHNADQHEGWKEKSWALRDAFDGVIAAIERRNAERQ